MQSKLYPEAIELYDCAIALCESNAVYYCNRCTTAAYLLLISLMIVSSEFVLIFL
jgi:hypothetical protein